MKVKISYFFAALVVYFITGVLLSYFLLQNVDWKYVIIWTVLMSIFDYMIIRNLSKWFTKRNKTK